jgi:hypothetical protein
MFQDINPSGSSMNYAYPILYILNDMLLFIAWSGTEWKKTFMKIDFSLDPIESHHLV